MDVVKEYCLQIFRNESARSQYIIYNDDDLTIEVFKGTEEQVKKKAAGRLYDEARRAKVHDGTVEEYDFEVSETDDPNIFELVGEDEFPSEVNSPVVYAIIEDYE